MTEAAIITYIPIELKLYAIEQDATLKTTIAEFINNIINKNQIEKLGEFISELVTSKKVNFTDYIDDGLNGVISTISSQQIFDFTKALNKTALIYIIEYLTKIDTITYKNNGSISIKFKPPLDNLLETPIEIQDVTLELYKNRIKPKNINDIRLSIKSSVIIHDFIVKNSNFPQTQPDFTQNNLENAYRSIYNALSINMPIITKENRAQLQQPLPPLVPQPQGPQPQPQPQGPAQPPRAKGKLGHIAELKKMGRARALLNQNMTV